MRRVAPLALCILLAQGGCSAMAASLAHHNSRGTSCMDEPVFPAIDLVGGSLGALALVYTGTAEESPGWLVLPGTFILSGLIASATVYACRHPDPDEATGVARPAKPVRWEDMNPPIHEVPSDRREDQEPEVRDATLEERGMTIPVTTPPSRIDEPPPVETTPVTCRINPLTPCPEGWSCVLTRGTEGVCRLDSDSLKPKTELPR